MGYDVTNNDVLTGVRMSFFRCRYRKEWWEYEKLYKTGYFESGSGRRC